MPVLAQRVYRDDTNTDLRFLNHEKLILPWVSFGASRGENIHCFGCQLWGAYVRKSQFRNSIWNGSRLNYADFSDCDLRDAELKKTNLSFTNFENADLRGAKLQGAFIWGTRFQGALFNEKSIFPFSHQEALRKGMRWAP